MNKVLLKLMVFLVRLGVGKMVWNTIKLTVIAIAQELPNLTNDEKRIEAEKRIKKLLREEGEHLKDNILHILIGTVIQSLK